MNKFKKTTYFNDWMKSLDNSVQGRINRRIERAVKGNFGDCKWNIDDGISEMRIHFGPGYRLYFYQQMETVYLLLCGGGKDTQQGDIIRARDIKNEIEGDKNGNNH